MTASKVVDFSTVHDPNRSIGAVLVEQGRLRDVDVENIRRFAEEHRLKFGAAAVQMRLVTQDDVEFALAQQFNYPPMAPGGAGGMSSEVVAAHDPQSEAVESLRTVRSRIVHGWMAKTQRRLLAITSSERGEGRSWMAANLAVLFAHSGHRTLLIDADMRYPRQHELFNVGNTVGLSALLTGRSSKELIHRIHPQLELFVLTAGVVPPNPQELLSRPVFDFVLQRFAEQFDIVILDTPAAAKFADAQIVAARAGAAVMVARRHHTRHSTVKAAVEGFDQTGVFVLGTVLNQY